MARILVVDDEPKIRLLARRFLEADGFEVVEAADGPAGLLAAQDPAVGLVLMDVAMPGLDGLEVLRRLRLASAIPVILVTARVDEVDQLIGLAVGADDYVTKPFSPRVLVAKCKAVLRRTAGDSVSGEPDLGLWRFDGLTIDRGRREVVVAGRVVALSALNFDLLVALAASPGRVLTRAQVLARVWGDDFFGDERVVDVHIRTLRLALGDDAGDPRVIQTVRAVGYRFRPSRT